MIKNKFQLKENFKINKNLSKKAVIVLYFDNGVDYK